MHDSLYAFVLRGELTKIALARAGVVSKHSLADTISEEDIRCISLDLLDDGFVDQSKQMAAIYIAISAFENMVRRFIVKTMIEYKGENWWSDNVSERIQRFAQTRKSEEEKIRWHAQRGDALVNYIEFGDLATIMQQNLEQFEVHIISIEWARQIFSTLERSRNVIMHSGTLERKDIERIGTNIRDWISQVGV